ncbi:MAG: hypothetical protein KDI63_01920 [Gammaproteobacteria bacterium]|nr:hypothetical protein [Gammaproteobacteria bacterium]
MKMTRNLMLTAALVAGIGTQALAGTTNQTGSIFDYSTEPSGLEMAADAFIVRPLTLGYSLLGAAGWVLALPVSVPAGNAEQAGRAWVSGPLKYTFMRPLGEMDEGVEPSYVQNPVQWE